MESIEPVADAPEAPVVPHSNRAGDVSVETSKGAFLPDSALPASTSLLSYYRQRIAEFENERDAFLQRFSVVEVAHADLHRTRWDLRVRQEEITELQNALSDANVQLFEEREQILKVLAENDQLKVQEIEDRRRIQHLLALTQPVAEEVTFFRDCRPNKMTRFPNSQERGTVADAGAVSSSSAEGPSLQLSLSARKSVDANVTAPVGTIPSSATTTPGGRHTDERARARSAGGSSRARRVRVPRAGTNAGGYAAVKSGAMTTSSGGGGWVAPYKNRVLRTIYLPSEKADTLLMTVDSLTKQLEENKKLTTERLKALQEDRQEREAAARRRRVRMRVAQLSESDDDRSMTRRAATDREAAVALEEKLHKTEEALRRTTQDYLVLRHNSQVRERALLEDSEMLRDQNARAQHELDQMRRRSHVEADAVRSAVQQDGELHVERFRQQAMDREEDLCVLKQQYDDVKKGYSSKLEDLETKHSALLKKHRLLEQRRQFDFEGFSNDVAELRRAVRRLETLFLGHALPADRAVEPSAPGLAHSTDVTKLSTPQRRSVLRSEIEQLRNRMASLEGEVDEGNVVVRRTKRRGGRRA